MRELSAVLTLTMGLACGGESEHAASRAGEGGESDHATTRAGEGGGESDHGATRGGEGGAEAQPGGAYIPDDSNVSATGDGRLGGGSFEGSLGSGWDFCRSKHPGATHIQDSDRSSHGSAWLAFDSQRSCAESFACGAEGGDPQVSLWDGPALSPGQPLHLYFDAINLGPVTPSGSLHIDAAEDDYCTSAGALATIPLPDLALTSDWSTRCVSFTPTSALSIFGVYVTGGAFEVGLDAFRFGPPCQN